MNEDYYTKWRAVGPERRKLFKNMSLGDIYKSFASLTNENGLKLVNYLIFQLKSI